MSRSIGGTTTCSPSMPVSSVASRRAAAARLASPSTWPPGWSQRCTLRWNSSRTRSTGGVDHQGRAGEVAGEARAQQRIGVGVDEGQHAGLHLGLLGVRSEVGGDHRPGHGRAPVTGRGPGRRPPAPGIARASDRPLDRSRARGPGDVGIVGNVPAPGSLDRGADADAGAPPGRRAAPRRRRRSSSAGPVDQVGAVERAVDAQGLAQLGRAVGQVAVAPGGRAGRPTWRRGRRAGRRPAAARATPSPSSPQTALAHQCMP